MSLATLGALAIGEYPEAVDIQFFMNRLGFWLGLGRLGDDDLHGHGFGFSNLNLTPFPKRLDRLENVLGQRFVCWKAKRLLENAFDERLAMSFDLRQNAARH
ncbi:MAG: hypothetical protein EOM24_17130 [Chloroflexia bacterium]|nr:hypothetical protein [Chloroflexia bacterium]